MPHIVRSGPGVCKSPPVFIKKENTTAIGSVPFLFAPTGGPYKSLVESYNNKRLSTPVIINSYTNTNTHDCLIYRWLYRPGSVEISAFVFVQPDDLPCDIISYIQYLTRFEENMNEMYKCFN